MASNSENNNRSTKSKKMQKSLKCFKIGENIDITSFSWKMYRLLQESSKVLQKQKKKKTRFLQTPISKGGIAVPTQRHVNGYIHHPCTLLLYFTD